MKQPAQATASDYV